MVRDRQRCRKNRAVTKEPCSINSLRLKLDSYRLRLEREENRVRLITRGGTNWADRYPWIVAAARNGWLDYDRAMMESLTAITRAGAGIILTYFAKPAARLL